jgi:SAM-dependent methyltransferase
MTGFTAEWLALREPHDLTARNRVVLDAVTTLFKSAASLHVVDLACGSGSTVDALHAHLSVQQHWDLVDHDADLLAVARNRNRDKDMTLNAIQLDLSRDIEAVLGATVNLITISALLDLVSRKWLDQFLHEMAARHLPVYAALTYDGRTDLSPADPFDSHIVSAVNAHQLTDKGFGPALGPFAASSTIAGLEALGYLVVDGESDWILRPDDREFQNEMLEGWANAAREMGTLPDAEIADWLSRRKALISEGLSSMRVGHVDFFAFPSSTRCAVRSQSNSTSSSIV